jgi:hypothetical protein
MAKAKPKSKPHVTHRIVFELYTFSTSHKEILEAAALYRRFMQLVAAKSNLKEEDLDHWQTAPLGDVLASMLGYAISGADITVGGLRQKIAQREAAAKGGNAA